MTHAVTTPVASPLAPARTAAESQFSLVVHLYRDYQQIVDFHLPGVAVLGLDECPPLGRGWGPSPVRLLGSAVGACLAGALMHALRDAGGTVIDLHTSVSGTVRADTFGLPHLASLSVRLTPVVATRGELASLPSPEQLAQLSMVADALRTDVPLYIAITPEVRSDTPAAREAARPGRLHVDTAARMPHFFEPRLR